MSALVTQTRSRVPRIAEAAVERARLTVVPRRARHAARVPFVTLVSVLLVLGVAGLLLFNTSMQQVSFKATAMEERAAVLDAKEQSLQMQLERLRDPQRVAQRALKMGMVPPASPAFIRLSDGKVLGDPTPASPLDRMRVTPLPTRKPSDLQPPLVIAEPPAVDESAPAPGTTTGTTSGTTSGTTTTTASGTTTTAPSGASSPGSTETSGHVHGRGHGAATGPQGPKTGTKADKKHSARQ